MRASRPRSAACLLALFLSACAGADVPKGGEASSADDSQTEATYRNDEYGFSFRYPAGGTIEENGAYLRMQNYPADDDRMGLAQGEYYLEVFITPESGSDCQTDVEDPSPVTVGALEGFRGYGAGGGDPGGIRFALCVHRADASFFFQATENDPSGPIARSILDSVLFEK